MLIQPLIGALSDKIVVVPQCYVSVLWQPFLPFLFLSIAERFFALCRFWSGDVRLLIVSFYTSISGILKAEMFPPRFAH